jgi:hypothetical protein
MRLLLTLRRRPGFRLIEYLSDDGHSVVRVPRQVWRSRPRREQGGLPFGGGASAIAQLAAALVEAHRNPDMESPKLPADMSSGDVKAAVRAACEMLAASLEEDS